MKPAIILLLACLVLSLPVLVQAQQIYRLKWNMSLQRIGNDVPYYWEDCPTCFMDYNENGTMVGEALVTIVYQYPTKVIIPSTNGSYIRRNLYHHILSCNGCPCVTAYENEEFNDDRYVVDHNFPENQIKSAFRMVDIDGQVHFTNPFSSSSGLYLLDYAEQIYSYHAWGCAGQGPYDVTEGPFKSTGNGIWDFHFNAQDSPYLEPDVDNRSFLAVGGPVPVSLSWLDDKNPPYLLTYDIRAELVCDIHFLDKGNLAREVNGACADGTAQVEIQIRSLPEDITLDQIKVSVPDKNDGDLREDAKIENGVYSQTYVAPEFFVRGDHQEEDRTQESREIGLNITVKDQSIGHAAFVLTRPPVVLIHGLWSDASTWNKFKSSLESNKFKYVCADSYVNSVHFSNLSRVIKTHCRQARLLAEADYKVARKVDVVGHSMGGLLTKLYGNEAYIKSITTIGTPHYGSELADILWDLVEEADQIWIDRFVANAFSYFNCRTTEGAIEDLRVTGGQNCTNHNCVINVPNYVIAGVSPLTDQTTVAFIGFLAKVVPFYKALPALANLFELNQLIFKNEKNDWAVSAPSQKGVFTNAVEVNVAWHLGETEDDGVISKTISFLNRTSNSSSVFQSEKVEGMKPLFKRDFRNIRKIGTSSGQIQIASPSEGQVFQPGDTVDVNVTVSNENALVLIASSTGHSALIDQAPYSFQFVIPNDVVGPVAIIAGARDQTGFIGEAKVQIRVSTVSNLVDLKIYPEDNSLNLIAGTEIPLRVYGIFDDSIMRDVTSSGNGTSYASSDTNVLAISPDGLLLVKALGQANISVENSGIKKDIYVVCTETGDNTITVVSPSGGESWDVGSSQNITWTSTGTLINVKVEYSTDGGANYTTLADLALNNGSYSWVLPNTPSTTCLVKVSDADYGTPLDVSDNVFTIKGAVIQRDDFVGTWNGQGVYYRDSDNGSWIKMASPATLIACGDLYGDGIDDLIGIWPGQGGVWVKNSANNAWIKLSSTARHIGTGDMYGDGRIDLLGTWDGQGVYYRDSINGSWGKLASPANLVTAGDLDGDMKDDLIGIWPTQGGVWVKYSLNGAWSKLSSTAKDIAAGDMNGDGRDELLATYDGQGVYYRDSFTCSWVKMATPADQMTCGDLDNDGKDDLIGIWPGQGGVWVKYSKTGAWSKLSSTATDIASGKMRAGGGILSANKSTASTSLPGILSEQPGNMVFGPENILKFKDLSAEGPGGLKFGCWEDKDLEPHESMEMRALRIPGPGEPGFRCIEQKNLFPQEQEKAVRENRQKAGPRENKKNKLK